MPLFTSFYQSNKNDSQKKFQHLKSAQNVGSISASSFANIKTIFEELGSSMDKIVKTTVFMVSGNDFSILNKVYGTVFRKMRPPEVLPG